MCELCIKIDMILGVMKILPMIEKNSIKLLKTDYWSVDTLDAGFT